MYILSQNNILMMDLNNDLKYQISILEKQILDSNYELKKLETQILRLSEESCRIPINIPDKNEWKGRFTNLIYSDEYNELFEINEKNIKFKIKNYEKNKIKSSYKIYSLIDNTPYILKLYERKNHFLNENKIEKEYDIFGEFLMKYYYYGKIKINGYEYNYTISKLYSTNFNTLSNIQKYYFLINNLKLLNKLQKNRLFHTDFKISNIGYDTNMDIVLINYDLETISEYVENEYIFKKRNFLKMRDELILKFPTTYIPTYVINNNITIDQLDKFSIKGLKKLIEELDINYSFKFRNNLPLPANELSIVSKYYIGKISPYSIYYDLNLECKDYYKIPSYAELIQVFEWLHENLFIV